MAKKFSNFEIKEQMEEVGSDLQLPDQCKDNEFENLDVIYLNYENLIDDIFLQDR